MKPDNADAMFALVVPESLRRWIERVPEEVRAKLGVAVWLVPDVGATPPAASVAVEQHRDRMLGALRRLDAPVL